MATIENSIHQSSVAAEASNVNKVIIIGAGACGLAIAQGLKQAGIPYALHERAESEYSKRNWTFGLHWGYHALEKLVPAELLAQIQSAQVDPTFPASDTVGIPLLNGETGEVLSRVKSDKIYRLLRDKFRNLLLQGLDIHWDKKLVNITYSADGQTATAHFADGSSDTGLAIIGCDGAHSAVRRSLVGEENAQLDPIGYACCILFARHTPEHAHYLRSEPLHPIFSTAVHPQGYFGFLSVHSAQDVPNPENWVFSSYISYAEPKDYVNTLSSTELFARQKKLGSLFAAPFGRAYEWATEENSQVEHVKLQNWDPRKPAHAWQSHGGRVSLGGDGAHAMTFQRGQGLNNAIQDAYEYVEATKKWWGKGNIVAERATAVKAYEEEMIARGGAEVQRSAETSDLFHKHYDQIASGMSQSMMKPE